MEWNNKKIEFIAIICLIIIGITLGIIFYFNNAKDISAVMLSIALASILYKFLGGIGNQNSITIGVLKLGGSAAVLFGFMYGIHEYIYDYNEKPVTIHPATGWIPVNENTGKAIDLQISTDDTILFQTLNSYSYKETLKKRELAVIPFSNSKFYILNIFTGDTIGITKLEKWNSDDMFSNIKFDDNEDAYRFSLYPDESKNCSTVYNDETKDLPFTIKVFRNRYIISIEDSIIANKEIVSRTGIVISIPHSPKVYMAFIEQANSLDDNIQNFSKWNIIPLIKTK